MSKYADWTRVQEEELLNKLGGEEVARRLLTCSEVTVEFKDRRATVRAVPATWREEDGVIYLSVTSDGTSGPDWIERLEAKNLRVSDYAKSVLHSPDFKPTSGVIYQIAVLKGELFTDRDRVTHKIRKEAERRNLTPPNAEIACLIREKFTDKDIEAMGLWWIITMHEPIKDSGGVPHLLGVDRFCLGRWLSAYFVSPDFEWHRACGFAFVSS